MFRNIVRWAAVLGAGIALTAVAAAPASAKPVDAAPAAVCDAHAQVPYKSGGNVKSAVSSSGCVNLWKFHFELQRERWYGWQNLDDADWSGNRSATLSYRCSGQGTYTYRVLIRSVNPLGYVQSTFTAKHRFTC